MRIAALFAMCTLFSPLLPADVILLTTRQRVDGVISSYANGELAVRLANATSEVKIPISQVLSFTIVRSMTEPMQPAPLVGTDARRQEMQQRSQERRQTVRTNQMVNRYNK
ncbi:hypothetical protein HS125_18870 [bacterium]|nr:hypothetical protein [bacterium]